MPVTPPVLNAAVLATLACPACHGDLRAEDTRLACISCHCAYSIIEGIPALIAGREIRPANDTDELQK